MTLPVFKKVLRMPATTPGLVVEDDNAWSWLQIIAAIGPQVGLAGFAFARVELCYRRSSHPKELPLQVLTEPYVNLSTHTALPIQSIYYHKTIASGQTSQVGVERHPAASAPLVAGVHGNV